jgi:hypothetical protein
MPRPAVLPNGTAKGKIIADHGDTGSPPATALARADHAMPGRPSAVEWHQPGNS